MCMPRPRSDDKRSAIIAATTRIIVTQGLRAPTAGIAKEAGVANGSLFTYFETKSDLFNALYLELKLEMASAVVKDLRKVTNSGSRSFTSGKTGWIGRCPFPRSGEPWLNLACPTKSHLQPGPRPIRGWQMSRNYWNVFVPSARCAKLRWVSFSRS